MSQVVSVGDMTSLWCDLILEELYRNGVEHICIAPGSRSAPLALAASRHTGLRSHTHYDERGLGFYALGLARGSDSPVVLVTTSGTAVANLYPALLEAKESAVPLLVLTADRPPELLGCGANQTLEQLGIFGHCPTHSINLPCPDSALPARWLLSEIDEAVAILRRPEAGVVHINQALRDPLYGSDQPQNWNEWLKPLSKWQQTEEPLCQWQKAVSDSLQVPDIEGSVVLVAGQLSETESKAVARMIKRTDWLLVADIQSGLQGHSRALPCGDLVLGNATILELLDKASLVIQCGRRLISKRLSSWLAQCDKDHWYVDARQDRQDPLFTVTHRISCSIDQFCKTITNTETASGSSWRDELLSCTRTLVNSVKEQSLNNDELTEIWVADQVKRMLSQQALFVGNSMPIRYLDSLSDSLTTAKIVTNRGVSGIDGLVATASGYSAAGQRTVLLIGDLSFLHDLGSLALASQQGLIIVLLNNSGGTIFNMFPVSQEDNTLSRYFRIEHELRCEGAASMFGLNYQQPDTCVTFQTVFAEALDRTQGTLIEVCTPPDQGTDQFKALVKAAREYRLC